MNEVQLDDIKIRIILTIMEDGEAVDISAATVKQIILRSPAGVTTTFTATFLTDGTEGKIYYETVSGDLNVAGLWKTQGKVEVSSGTYRSDIHSFRVHSNL